MKLKIWYGEKYEEEGIKQFKKYLDICNNSEGYMITFNFNKNKEYKKEWINKDNKNIYSNSITV